MKKALRKFSRLSDQISQFGMEEEISFQWEDIASRSHPLVLVYPEATIYGPVTPADVQIVEEHLYKGRVERKQISAKNIAGGFLG